LGKGGGEKKTGEAQGKTIKGAKNAFRQDEKRGRRTTIQTKAHKRNQKESS